MRSAPVRSPGSPSWAFSASYSDANLEFVKAEGFTSMQLRLDPDKLDDAAIAAMKDKIQRSGIYISSLAVDGNHIDPDPAKRAQQNQYDGQVHRAVRQAGNSEHRRAIRHDQGEAARPSRWTRSCAFTHEKYFPLCEKHKVRMLWEPYAGGPNIATGPVGWEALFKAFGNSPHVGLQFDPSHLVWQFMDPVQAARDFADKIYDVHLKDTEILWHVVRRAGIQPVNHAQLVAFPRARLRLDGLERLLLGAGGSGLHRAR